jgi:hypothetical protein
MNNRLFNIRAARSTASTISTLKSLSVTVVAIVTVIVVLTAFADEATGFGFVLLLGGALTAFVVSATFGWFEHTLTLLSDLASDAVPVEESEPGTA